MPAGARGHYKSQCNARWHKIEVFSLTTASIFMKTIFKKLRKISWIQIFMLEYVVTTSTGTFGS